MEALEKQLDAATWKCTETELLAYVENDCVFRATLPKKRKRECIFGAVELNIEKGTVVLSGAKGANHKRPRNCEVCIWCKYASGTNNFASNHKKTFNENGECSRRSISVPRPIPSTIATEHLRSDVKSSLAYLRTVRATGNVKLLKQACIRILQHECENSKVKQGLVLSELAVAYDMYGNMDSLQYSAGQMQLIVDEMRAAKDTNDTLEVRNDIIHSILARRISRPDEFRFLCEDAANKLNVSYITKAEAKYHYACERKFVLLGTQHLLTEDHRDEELDKVADLYLEACKFTVEAVDEEYVRICTGRTLCDAVSVLMIKTKKDEARIRNLLDSIAKMPCSHWVQAHYLLMKIKFAYFCHHEHIEVQKFAGKAKKEAQNHKMKHIALMAEAIEHASDQQVGNFKQYYNEHNNPTICCKKH
jgi:hypothetical protein